MLLLRPVSSSTAHAGAGDGYISYYLHKTDVKVKKWIITYTTAPAPAVFGFGNLQAAEQPPASNDGLRGVSVCFVAQLVGEIPKHFRFTTPTIRES